MRLLQPKTALVAGAVLILLGIIAALLNIFTWFLLFTGLLVALAGVLVLVFLRSRSFEQVRRRHLQAHPFEQNLHKDLMVGSSFFEGWVSASRDFAPLDILNIGIGGTVIQTWIDFLENTVAPYQPRSLILYAGSNDFNQAATAELVFARLAALFDQIEDRLPGIPVVYIGICPTIARQHSWPEIQKFNRLVEQACAARAHFYFVDSAPAILDAAGQLRPELYLPDTLHFNPQGYQAWAGGVCPQVIGILRPPAPA